MMKIARAGLLSLIATSAMAYYDEPNFALFDMLLYNSPNGDNFKLERHTVTTEDGYILNLMRLVHKEKPHKLRKPLLFQHGISCNGAFWLWDACTRSPVAR